MHIKIVGADGEYKWWMTPILKFVIEHNVNTLMLIEDAVKVVMDVRSEDEEKELMEMFPIKGCQFTRDTLLSMGGTVLVATFAPKYMRVVSVA